MIYMVQSGCCKLWYIIYPGMRKHGRENNENKLYQWEEDLVQQFQSRSRNQHDSWMDMNIKPLRWSDLVMEATLGNIYTISCLNVFIFILSSCKAGTPRNNSVTLSELQLTWRLDSSVCKLHLWSFDMDKLMN